MKTSSGFSLADMMVALAVILTLFAIGIPAYQNNMRTRAVQSGARILAAAMRERKQRAVALATSAGLCIDPNNLLYFYEYHPFAGGTFFIPKTIDLNQTLGVAVVLSSSLSGGGEGWPCSAGQTLVGFDPGTDPTLDWQGTITLASGASAWHLTARGGVFNDGP